MNWRNFLLEEVTCWDSIGLHLIEFNFNLPFFRVSHLCFPLNVSPVGAFPGKALEIFRSKPDRDRSIFLSSKHPRNPSRLQVINPQARRISSPFKFLVGAFLFGLFGCWENLGNENLNCCSFWLWLPEKRQN